MKSLPAKLLINMVGTTGFEPATSSVSRKRSNQLSYAPAKQYLIVYQDWGGRNSGWAAARMGHAVPSLTNEELSSAGSRRTGACTGGRAFSSSCGKDAAY